MIDQSILNFSVFREHFQDADIHGFQSGDSPPILKYDSEWLKSPSPLIRELWCKLHRSLTKKSINGNKFDVLIWLSTMAYASKADMDVIRALVALYRVPEMAPVEIPSKPLYQLSQGSRFDVNHVQTVAEGNSPSYQSSSEAQLPKQVAETEKEHLRGESRTISVAKRTHLSRASLMNCKISGHASIWSGHLLRK